MNTKFLLIAQKKNTIFTLLFLSLMLNEQSVASSAAPSGFGGSGVLVSTAGVPSANTVSPVPVVATAPVASNAAIAPNGIIASASSASIPSVPSTVTMTAPALVSSSSLTNSSVSQVPAGASIIAVPTTGTAAIVTTANTTAVATSDPISAAEDALPPEDQSSFGIPSNPNKGVAPVLSTAAFGPGVNSSSANASVDLIYLHLLRILLVALVLL